MLGLQLIYVSKRAPRKLAVLKKNIEINELRWTLGNTLVHSRRKGCLIHVFCDHSTGGKTPLSEIYPFHKESVSWNILTSTVQAFGKGWTGKCCCISWKKSIQMFSLPVPIIISLFLILLIVRRAGLLWSQQDFEWRWSVPLFKCLTVLEFSFILFDLCLLITFFNFIMKYVPIVTFWIFTYHKIWILSIMFCFIWSYWIIYFLACLEVSWRVVS